MGILTKQMDSSGLVFYTTNLLRSYSLWLAGYLRSTHHSDRPPVPFRSTPCNASVALNLYGLTIQINPDLNGVYMLGSILYLMGPVYVTNHPLPYLPISLFRIIPHSGLKRLLGRLLLLLAIDFYPGKKRTPLAHY